MPADHEHEIVSHVPQFADIALGELLRADYGDRAVLLAAVVERARQSPQDALTAFSNFVTIETG